MASQQLWGRDQGTMATGFTCRLHTLSAPCAVAATFVARGSGPFRIPSLPWGQEWVGKLDKSCQWSPWRPVLSCTPIFWELWAEWALPTQAISGGPCDFDFFVVFLWNWNPGPSMKQVVCYWVTPYLKGQSSERSSEVQLGGRAFTHCTRAWTQPQQQRKKKKMSSERISICSCSFTPWPFLDCLLFAGVLLGSFMYKTEFLQEFTEELS